MTVYNFETAFQEAFSSKEYETRIYCFIDGVHYIILSDDPLSASKGVYIHWDGKRNAIMTMVNIDEYDAKYVRETYIWILGMDDAIKTRNVDEIKDMIRLIYNAYEAALETGRLRWDLLEGLRACARR